MINLDVCNKYTSIFSSSHTIYMIKILKCNLQQFSVNNTCFNYNSVINIFWICNVSCCLLIFNWNRPDMIVWILVCWVLNKLHYKFSLTLKKISFKVATTFKWFSSNWCEVINQSWRLTMILESFHKIPSFIEIWIITTKWMVLYKNLVEKFYSTKFIKGKLYM